MNHSEAINSPAKPEVYGQCSVFKSPANTWLVDIATFNSYGKLAWYAVPNESTLYEAAIQDHLDGVLEITNYSLYLENGRP